MTDAARARAFCPECQGSGIEHGYTCPACLGTGRALWDDPAPFPHLAVACAVSAAAWLAIFAIFAVIWWLS